MLILQLVSLNVRSNGSLRRLLSFMHASVTQFYVLASTDFIFWSRFLRCSSTRQHFLIYVGAHILILWSGEIDIKLARGRNIGAAFNRSVAVTHWYTTGALHMHTIGQGADRWIGRPSLPLPLRTVCNPYISGYSARRLQTPIVMFWFGRPVFEPTAHNSKGGHPLTLWRNVRSPAAESVVRILTGSNQRR